MFTAGYPAAQSTTHNYSQSTQGYGANAYESTPAAAAAPAASQSYGSQPGYTAQSAYPGYGQQAAPTAPQRYVYSNLEKILVTKIPIALVKYFFGVFFLLCFHQLQC